MLLLVTAALFQNNVLLFHTILDIHDDACIVFPVLSQPLNVHEYQLSCVYKILPLRYAHHTHSHTFPRQFSSQNSFICWYPDVVQNVAALTLSVVPQVEDWPQLVYHCHTTL